MESVKEFLRPVMVSLVGCKKVLLDGPTFQNSPAWCLHPLMSENVTVRNLTIRNPWYSQNGDGLDLESCKNVVIEKVISMWAMMPSVLNQEKIRMEGFVACLRKM